MQVPVPASPPWGRLEGVCSAVPEVLVLTADIGRQLHYDRIVPNGHTFWKVDSITHARFIMMHATTVKVVVVEMEPMYCWPRSTGESMRFIKWLRDQGYTGSIIVVRRYVSLTSGLTPYGAWEMEAPRFARRGWENLTQIFSDTASARDLLWVEWSKMLERSPSSRLHVLDEGPEILLTWLDEFEQTVRDGDVRAIYNELIQMNVSTGTEDDCDCREEAYRADKWLIWFHLNHALYNRAVWEMLAAMPGLLAALRVELLDDMESTGFASFGRHVRKSYGLRLWTFLQDDGPDPMWV